MSRYDCRTGWDHFSSSGWVSTFPIAKIKCCTGFARFVAANLMILALTHGCAGKEFSLSRSPFFSRSLVVKPASTGTVQRSRQLPSACHRIANCRCSSNPAAAFGKDFAPSHLLSGPVWYAAEQFVVVARKFPRAVEARALDVISPLQTLSSVKQKFSHPRRQASHVAW